MRKPLFSDLLYLIFFSADAQLLSWAPPFQTQSNLRYWELNLLVLQKKIF